LDSTQTMAQAPDSGLPSPPLKGDLPTILLAEDNEDDVFLMKRALAQAGIRNPVFVLEDGQEAVDYLAGAGAYVERSKFPFPVIMFLDLKMPRKSGLEVLKWVRASENFKALVVVVLTSSEEPADISRAYREGANSYLVKPPTGEELLKLAKSFKFYWLELNCFESGPCP
jgi:CheY-like chemotaxis protein